MTTTARPATDPIAAAHRSPVPRGLHRAPVMSDEARAAEVHAMNFGPYRAVPGRHVAPRDVYRDLDSPELSGGIPA